MGTRMIHEQFLQDADGTDMSLYAFTSGTAVFTRPVNTRLNNGFTALLVSAGTGTLDMDISQEVSLDGIHFYDPYTTNGTTLTNTSQIVVTVTTTRWIIVSPPLAPYTRFKFDPDGTGSWTIKYIHQEDAS